MNLRAIRHRNEPQTLVEALQSYVEQPKPVDLDEAAAEKALGMRPMADVVATFAPVSSLPLPDYVEHAPNATRSGMLSAQAIVMEYEATAKEIEKLGDELRAAHARAEERQAVLAAALNNLTETAKAFREEAARVFAQVEEATAKASEASALCQELRSKVVLTATS